MKFWEALKAYEEGKTITHPGLNGVEITKQKDKKYKFTPTDMDAIDWTIVKKFRKVPYAHALCHNTGTGAKKSFSADGHLFRSDEDAKKYYGTAFFRLLWEHAIEIELEE